MSTNTSTAERSLANRTVKTVTNSPVCLSSIRDNKTLRNATGTKSKRTGMINTPPGINGAKKLENTITQQSCVKSASNKSLTPKQLVGKKDEFRQKPDCYNASPRHIYTPNKNNKNAPKSNNKEIKNKQDDLSVMTKSPNLAISKSYKQNLQNKSETAKVKSKSNVLYSPQIKINLAYKDSYKNQSAVESIDTSEASIVVYDIKPSKESESKESSKRTHNSFNLKEQSYHLPKTNNYRCEFKSSHLNSTVSVYVRVRPFTNRESTLTNVHSVISVMDNSIIVKTEAGNTHCFCFDSCISSDNTSSQYGDQEFTYNQVASPLLGHVIEGYNICLFAYGQTGSGKSYSMMGTKEKAGIIPRFCKHLFSHVSKIDDQINYVIEISYFEIYNEKIHDLLMPSNNYNNKITLKVREHPTLGPYIQDLTSYVVASYNDLLEWLILGNKHRATAVTGMNDRSSRSHSIFTINLIQIKNETIGGELHEHKTISRINLVDLAGSERIDKAETSEERLKEGVNINKSLLTLGKVIAQLVDRGNIQINDVNNTVTSRKNVFVPYRESILTWILKDSLGGNSRTTMLATISPCNIHVEETLSTLRFARQASKIVNVVRVNEDPKTHLIKELEAEIERLRNEQQVGDVRYFIDEIAVLKSQLQETQTLLNKSKKDWEERLLQTEKRKEEEKLKLKKVGIALKMEGSYPSLINLNDDPQLSEILLYILKPGITKIGRLEEQSTAEIQLQGKLVTSNHCIIKNEDNTVTIIPNEDAVVYVNGQLITEITKLSHGDRLVIGGERFFRVNNPYEENVLQVNVEERDFEYAYQELIEVQESKLQEEFDKSRQKKCNEILEKFESLKEEMELEISLQKSSDNVIEDENNELNISREFQFNSRKSDIKEFAPYSSNFLDQITEMFNDMCIDLDTWKSKLDISLQTEIEHDSYQTKEKFGKLYQLSIKLKEANELTKELGTDIVLSRCDILTNTGLEQAIKVHSVNHQIVTFWSLKVFEERLERLQRLSQELVFSKNSIYDIFEATDNWENQEEMPINIHNDKKVDLKQIQKRLNQSLSSTGSTDAVFSFSGKDFRRSVNESLDSPTSTSSFILITEACRSQLTKEIYKTNDGKNLSFLDQAILTNFKVWQYINKMKENQDLLKSKEDAINLTISLTADFACLQCIILGWIGIYINENNPIWLHEKCMNIQIIDLKKLLTKLEKAINFILQGIGKNLENLLTQSVDVAHHTICHLTSLLGEMSVLSKDASYVSVFDKINGEFSNSLFENTVHLIEKVCQISWDEIEDYELQYNSVIEDSFFGPIKEYWLIFPTVKHIISKVKDYLKIFCFEKKYNTDSESFRYYRACINVTHHIIQVTDRIIDFISAVDLLFKGNSQGEALISASRYLFQLIDSYNGYQQWPSDLVKAKFKEMDELRIEIGQSLQLLDTKINKLLKSKQLFPVISVVPREENDLNQSDNLSRIPGSSSVFALSSFFTSQLEDVIDI